MSALEQRILDALTNPSYQPLKASALAQSLRIRKKQLHEFRETLVRLQSDGRVQASKSGKLRTQAGYGEIVGIIKRVGSGGGYVIPHDAPRSLNGQDIYVFPEHVRDAHTGDEVVVQLTSRRRSGGQRCGKVHSVIERATHQFVGTYYEEDGRGLVRIDGGTITQPIQVGDPGAKGAKPDDKVVLEMLRFPTTYAVGEGVLTEVLGPRGTPGVDTLSTIHQFNLSTDFSPEALDEAREQAERFAHADPASRRDLTKDVTITIDPKDARDFDDAISLKRTADGHWHLAVHIADVAHFVPAGGVLDQEAQERATSVYLPGRVVPMLPELISNGLASLQQGQLRFTKTAFIEFDPDGIPLATDFANTAINVNRRFAYEDVMPIVHDPEKYKGRVSAKVRQLLAWMYELAMMLRRRRFAAGALELFLPEVELEFDNDGKVSGAHERDHDESHQIIEEFMLAANIAVATALADRELPFLSRAHAPPDEKKLKTFAAFAKALGYPVEQYQSRQELQAVIRKVRGQPKEEAINYALLRSMKQAVYSPSDSGHYALAEEYYCHFTSPIRRYPDLTIHRLLDDALLLPGEPRHLGMAELVKLGKHCSDRERRAADAERDLIKYKLLNYIADFIGEELEATITGVERFGLFCRGAEVPVEGLVHITSLEPLDRYEHDDQSFSLIGRRTGKTWQLGDRIRVVVAHVDIDKRELDFRVVPVDPKKRKRGPNNTPKAGKNKSGKGKPKTAKRDGSVGKSTGKTRAAAKGNSPVKPKKKRRR